MRQAVCVRGKRNEKEHEIPPHPKHTTKSTAARRLRPPRDGVRRYTSHALTHTRPLHRSRVCGNRPRTTLASVKTTNVTHTRTDRQTGRQTDELNNGTPPLYEEAFLPYKQKTTSVASLSWPCLIINSYGVDGL